MKWKIEYSRDAEKFIDKQDVHIEVREELKKFLIKMKGGSVNPVVALNAAFVIIKPLPIQEWTLT
jgi:hypothetical protein